MSKTTRIENKYNTTRRGIIIAAETIDGVYVTYDQPAIDELINGKYMTKSEIRAEKLKTLFK